MNDPVLIIYKKYLFRSYFKLRLLLLWLAHDRVSGQLDLFKGISFIKRLTIWLWPTMKNSHVKFKGDIHVCWNIFSFQKNIILGLAQISFRYYIHAHDSWVWLCCLLLFAYVSNTLMITYLPKIMVCFLSPITMKMLIDYIYIIIIHGNYFENDVSFHNCRNMV